MSGQAKPPLALDSEAATPAVAYVRLSTMQRYGSIEKQAVRIKEHAERSGLDVVIVLEKGAQ
jgi:hypothetical protein